MPYIIADKNGVICEGRNKIYPTERGAKMGYKAALETFLQMAYLHEEGLDYAYYLSRVIPDQPFAFTNVGDIEDIEHNARRWDELTAQFEATYSIEEFDLIKKG